MAPWDPPPLPDDLRAPPHPPQVPPPPTAFRPIRPLILQVSPPPGSSDSEEYYYDPSPVVTQSSFAAAQAFFMANRHKAETLECPDLNAFFARSPGAIIRQLSKLPVLVFSKGGQLLLVQAIAGLTSTVGGFALGGRTPTVAPRSFLDRYLEVPPPSQLDSLFTTVLLSHVTLVLPVQGGGPPAPAQVRHGGPPSCPDPVCINVASSAYPAPFWGAWPPLWPPPAVCPFFPGITRGKRPLRLWGLLPYSPPMTSVTTIMATGALLRIMGATRLPNCLRRCMGGVMLLLGMYPHLCMVVGPFPRAMGGIPIQLHWFPQAWGLRTRHFTLLCCRRITVPPLDLTLPYHFPALFEAYLLLSWTIPMPPGLFHLPPCLVLLPPHLLRQKCSSSIPSKT